MSETPEQKKEREEAEAELARIFREETPKHDAKHDAEHGPKQRWGK